MDFQYEKGRIFAEDATGKLLAEITFPVTDGVAVIDHTFVDDSLRGQGVADQLVTAAVTQLRSQGVRVVPVCSYAQRWFSTHPGQSDVLGKS